jgi:hypothetical protein
MTSGWTTDRKLYYIFVKAHLACPVELKVSTVFHTIRLDWELFY